MMSCCLRFGITLLLAVLVTEVWTQNPPLGSVRTECQGSVMMMMMLDKSFVGKYFRINVIDNKGVLVSLSPRLAAQCGYSLTVDFLGNAKFLASVVSCFAQNTNDETYKLTVQISVFSNSAMTSASSYVQCMTCRYSPWAEREILCERNYMEVSVRRGVPLIEPNFVQDDPDWSLAYPEATAADNSIWKIVFHLPGNRKTTMTVAQAMTNGYGINTTPTRILVRAAYNSTESQPQVIQTVPMAVLRSTTFYKQRWMVMMVDTAVTCPTDGTAFTEQMITWNVPRVLPPLVPTPQITTLDVQMGVDGRKLDPAMMHSRDYKLDVGPQLIAVKILMVDITRAMYWTTPM
ncbi:uncharacterized protein LOC131703198 [Acipenser ruthenus]|uniref:uncharacterized protein LOC131703198 n=1 Tax=Acipenser ruthenus TaxID=7906 RepID=UPI002741F234|nr:uncharacterized protein LOC131703198 [Acipenser ruthenus]